MDNNELLRHLRKLLALNETGMTNILALGNLRVSPEQMRHWLRHDNETGYEPCPDPVPVHFIEGLIIHQRGPREGASPVTATAPLTNNQILKKLRIAFNLQNEDMHRLFAAAGNTLSKQELDGFFRKPEHKNYRVCNDRNLRLFLQAMADHFRSR